MSQAKHLPIPRVTRAQRNAPVHLPDGRLSPEVASAVIEAAARRPRSPSMRIHAARDAAILVLVAHGNLHGYWLSRLDWSDVLAEPVPAIRLADDGPVCLMLLTEASVEALEAWRDRLGRWLGRPVEDADPLFPSFAQGQVAGRPPRMYANTIGQMVQRRLLEGVSTPASARSATCGGRSRSPRREPVVDGVSLAAIAPGSALGGNQLGAQLLAGA